MRHTPRNGFTLIEVLLALAVIAIALTALIKATGQNIVYAQRLTERTVSHWVAQQGVVMIQSGLLHGHQHYTEVTTLFGQRWYWQATLHPTSMPHVKKIEIKTSQKQSGPFAPELVAYGYFE